MSPTAMAISPNHLTGGHAGFSENDYQEGYAMLADVLAEPSPKHAKANEGA